MTRLKPGFQIIGVTALGLFALVKAGAGDWPSAVVAIAAAALLAVS